MRKLSSKKYFSLLQSRQGGKLFSYQDTEGRDHFLTGSNCNRNDPTWLMDSIEISDIGVLPVLGVKYGPLLYEEEGAKVIIGPIKCQAPPLDSWQEFTTEGLSNNFKTELTNKIQSHATIPTKIEQLHHCVGNNDPRYRIIQNQCFYFEKVTKSFDNARANCKQKGGKLYEPEDAVKMKEIAKISHGTLGNVWAWIGITDIASEGNYVYDSTGLGINFIPLWHYIYGTRGTSYNCVSVLTQIGHYKVGKLSDNSCLGNKRSICEL